MSDTKLFRLRRLLVCPGCDLGYRAGRLAGFGADGTILCATCLIGADPDTDNDVAYEETSPPCPTQHPQPIDAAPSPDCLPGMPG